MKDPKDIPDLDQLLAAQPHEPTTDFVAKTLERAKNSSVSVDDAQFDAELDAFLMAQPIEPKASLAENVLAQVQSESTEATEDKIIGFPSWVVTLSAFAASLIIGMVAFVALFQEGLKDRQTMPQAQVITQPIGTSPLEDELLIAQNNIPAESSGLAEMEELLIMDHTLSELFSVENDELLMTLALLTE